MARKAGREKEFARWPKYKNQYIRTFGRMIEARKAAGLKIFDVGHTAQEWFEWWMSDRPMNDKDEAQYEIELSEY